MKVKNKMFGFSTKEKIIEKQNDYISRLEAENKRYKESIAFVNDKQISESDFVVDFEKMNAFSIERMPAGDGEYKTSIGYFFGDQVKEWVLRCDRRTHNKLAHEFREYMKDSKGKKK